MGLVMCTMKLNIVHAAYEIASMADDPLLIVHLCYLLHQLIDGKLGLVPVLINRLLLDQIG